MAEKNQYDQEPKPQIREGLSAIMLPELGERNNFDDLRPVPEAEALNKLNDFLAELNAQGADIVSVLDVEVSVGKKPSVIGESTENRKIAVVRKGKQA